MKKTNILTGLFCILISVFYSCDDQGYKDGNSVVYLTNNEVSVDVYDIEDSFTYNLGVYRSGFGAEAKVKVKVLSDFELEEHNITYGTSYKLLPESSYKLLLTEVNFGSSAEDTNQYIPIEFDVQALKLLDLANENYVIPVAIDNSSIGVNEDLAISFVSPAVKDPLVYFVFTDLKSYNFEIGKVTAIDLDIPIQVDFENKWDITCELTTPQSVLDKYNEDNNKFFVMLPSDAYTLQTSVTIENGTKKNISKLHVEGDKLEAGSYALPVYLNSVSKFNIDPAANTYIIGINIPAPLLDRTGWTITASSFQSPEGPENVLDGDLDTKWHTKWSGIALPQELIIDMQKEYNVTQIDMTQRNEQSNRDSKGGNVYISSDNATWTNIGNFEMQAINGFQQFGLKATRGRYLKVEFTSSYRGTNLSIGELEVHGTEVE